MRKLYPDTINITNASPEGSQEATGDASVTDRFRAGVERAIADFQRRQRAYGWRSSWEAEVRDRQQRNARRGGR